MKIINAGKKDYYDYLSGIYGIDTDIVYDRRDYNVFRKYDSNAEFFLKEPLYGDSFKTNKRGYRYVNGKGVFGKFEEGKILYILIEIGFIQYFFKIERYLINENEVRIEPTLFDKKIVSEKKSDCVLSVIPLECYNSYNEGLKISKFNNRFETKNPIFSDTWVTSVIPPEEIYQNIYDYLISVKEPKIEDKRNDIQKLESKGFDKKESFRNPVINANSSKHYEKRKAKK